MKPREKENVSRVSGLAAVSALFAQTPQRIERLFFEEHMRNAAGPFCAALAVARKPYRMVGSEELARVAGTAMHGGIVAVAQPRFVPAFDATQLKQWVADGQPLLILDGIGNPHNLGAIARTAAFFGIPRIILSNHPAQAGLSDAAYRVAEGGIDSIAFYKADPFDQALRHLRLYYRLLATAPGKNKSLADIKPGDKPFAIILGNEEEGLSPQTQKSCDDIIAIPSAGRIQSLNVAASAAILIYTLSIK